MGDLSETSWACSQSIAQGKPEATPALWLLGPGPTSASLVIGIDKISGSVWAPETASGFYQINSPAESHDKL
jgi:hypothetical protein